MIQKMHNNKFKSLICLLLLVFCSFLSVGCWEQNSDLDMNYYTLTSSTYTLFNSYDEVRTSSSDFIGATPISRQYDKIDINLSSEWLYNFEINTLSFDVLTNETAELQFSICVTNLKDGSIVGAKQVKQKTYTIYTTYQANQTKSEEILIKDIFELSTAETIISIELVNTEVYASSTLNFAIFNVKLNGKLSYN
ncbi:MAG: hypothetical protein K6F08_03885 [bacterium]|nr:hypothetical protein [bacterium]